MNIFLQNEILSIAIFSALSTFFAISIDFTEIKLYKFLLGITAFACIVFSLFLQQDNNSKVKLEAQNKEDSIIAERKDFKTLEKNLRDSVNYLIKVDTTSKNQIIASSKLENQKLRINIDTLKYDLDKAQNKISNLDVKIAKLQDSLIFIENKNYASIIHHFQPAPGSYFLPYFIFQKNNKLVSGIFKSKSKADTKDIDVEYINFSGLLKGCELSTVTNTFDNRCYDRYSRSIGHIATFGAHRVDQVDIPQIKKRAKEGKVLVQILFNGETYYDEAIFKIENDTLKQSTRVIKMVGDKIGSKRWLVSQEDYDLNNVSWDIEFPINMLPIFSNRVIHKN